MNYRELIVFNLEELFLSSFPGGKGEGEDLVLFFCLFIATIGVSNV